MKKVFILFLYILAGGLAQAQTIDNAGMENWRSATVLSPASPPALVPIQAPKMWFGSDSLALALGPIVGGTSGDPFNRQLFKETTLVRTGAASAKVMSALEGDFGIIPGVLSNAKILVNTGASSFEEAITFEGGQAVTEQPSTVSAWVVYKPGIDPATDSIGYDEGLMTVSAIATIGVIDSAVGVGFINITPSDTDTFTQVTATLTYTTTTYPVHTLRIVFASSGDAGTALDSSTLYVDDITMTGVPNPPPPTSVATAHAEDIRVFPNPAREVLYIEGGRGKSLSCTLQSIDGRVARTIPLTGSDKVDLAAYPAGAYLYRVTDTAGKTVREGKLTVTH